MTLQSPGNESQRKHTAILRNSNRQSIQSRLSDCPCVRPSVYLSIQPSNLSNVLSIVLFFLPFNNSALSNTCTAYREIKRRILIYSIKDAFRFKNCTCAYFIILNLTVKQRFKLLFIGFLLSGFSGSPAIFVHRHDVNGNACSAHYTIWFMTAADLLF